MWILNLCDTPGLLIVLLLALKSYMIWEAAHDEVWWILTAVAAHTGSLKHPILPSTSWVCLKSEFITVAILYGGQRIKAKDGM